MLNQLEIENIEEMRRQQGIDDVELAEAIRRLKIGDVVNLTFLTKTHSFETTPVQITQIRGIAFRGKLLRTRSRARRDTIVEFTISHIHSVVMPSAKRSSSRTDVLSSHRVEE